MPVRSARRSFRRGVQTDVTLGIQYPQTRTAVGSDRFRPDVCTQLVGLPRNNRNQLIGQLILGVLRHCEIGSKSACSTVRCAVGKIKVEIWLLPEVPV